MNLNSRISSLDNADVMLLAAEIALTLNRHSPVTDFIAVGNNADACDTARSVLCAMTDTLAGAMKVAEVCTGHAAQDAANVAAYKDARKEGREHRAPFSESVYIQTRRTADKNGFAFTVRKETDKKTKKVEFIGCERDESSAKSKAAKGARAARKVTEPRADLTDSQAIKQIRALLKLDSTSNRATVEAISALLSPSPAGKLPRVAKGAVAIAKRA